MIHSSSLSTELTVTGKIKNESESEATEEKWVSLEKEKVSVLVWHCACVNAGERGDG